MNYIIGDNDKNFDKKYNISNVFQTFLILFFYEYFTLQIKLKYTILENINPNINTKKCISILILNKYNIKLLTDFVVTGFDV